MLVLVVLILFYLLILQIGKFARKVNFLGYLFVGILTAVEVVAVMYLLFVMDVPKM